MDRWRRRPACRYTVAVESGANGEPGREGRAAERARRSKTINTAPIGARNGRPMPPDLRRARNGPRRTDLDSWRPQRTCSRRDQDLRPSNRVAVVIVAFGRVKRAGCWSCLVTEAYRWVFCERRSDLVVLVRGAWSVESGSGSGSGRRGPEDLGPSASMRLPFVVEQTSVGGPRVRWPVAIPRLDGRSRRKSIKRRKGLLLQKVLPQPEREREARASEKKNRQCGVFWSIQTKRASRSQDGDPLAVASFGGLAALLFLFSLRDTRPGVNLLLSDWPRSLSSLPSRNSGEIRSHLLRVSLFAIVPASRLNVPGS
ncbi:hypothetical protein IWX47DRAFT_546894 [Phyllosticta citricarpa]